jgi:diaminohydroxyphosphoribosylaminopyrimidine deaminase/5-amino-6-(5-phosphoribosylamino)uracil reductase
VVGATDPNPEHRGKAFRILKRARLKVASGVLADDCTRLNESFNHWIVHRTPFVTVKAAMTLDGKIATATGESKWISGEKARAYGMKLRQASDAILVGVNTVLADDPSLTWRGTKSEVRSPNEHRMRRIILDSRARTPLTAKVVTDDNAAATTIVVARTAPDGRVRRLADRVRVLKAPEREGRIELRWLLRKLGREEVTSLLVEGGGEVNAAFLSHGLAHRIAFFYAPKILGGRDARKAVAGSGASRWSEVLELGELHWQRLGVDLLLTARVEPRRTKSSKR